MRNEASRLAEILPEFQFKAKTIFIHGREKTWPFRAEMNRALSHVENLAAQCIVESQTVELLRMLLQNS